MPWWLWAGIAVVALIVMVIWFSYRATKNPAGYMSRSQLRLKLAERLVDEVVESLLKHETLPKNIMKTEGKLYALAEAQREERLPDPIMTDHREAYTQLLRFQWLKVQDIRVTGGKNLDDIAAAENEFGQHAEMMARERFDAAENLRRQMGLAPRDWDSEKHT